MLNDCTFSDGTFNVGVFCKTPAQILCYIPWTCVGNSTHISIGCQSHTYEYWQANKSKLINEFEISPELAEKVQQVINLIASS